ncbi:MAG: ComEC/Rec2 family competence protein [Planctomycetales bacterium]|nr:ComEC/Rec2 family competence protein [Planctomycetales bacterium]
MSNDFTPADATPDSGAGYYRPLAIAAVAVGAGIVAARLGGDHWLWLPPAAAGVLLIAFVGLRRGNSRRHAATACLLIALACVGAIRDTIGWRLTGSDDLGRFARRESEPVCLRARLVESPTTSPPPANSPLRGVPLGAISQATVEVLGIRDGKVWRTASGRCRLRVAGELLHADAGDEVLVFAKLGRPGVPLNPGQYDWAAAERTNGRLSEVYCADPECVQVLAPASRWTPAVWAAALREYCEESLRAAVGPKQGDLAAAVILGARDQLDEETTETFLRTGTIHLMVVSGLHVGMLAALAWGTLRLLGVHGGWRTAGTLLALGCYVAAVGPRPPVMRASVLVAAWLTAAAAGRRPTPANVLAAAGLAVAAFNPAELFRGGTQLSFVSAAVFAALGEQLAKRRQPSPLQRLIDETRSPAVKLAKRVRLALWLGVITSTAIWIIAGPLVAAEFHIVTPVGILLTPLIMPLVGVALAAGLASVACGWLLPPVAAIAGGVCGGCLQLTADAVAWADSWQAGHFYTAGPAPWWLAGWYGAGAVALLMPRLRFSLSQMIALAACWAAFGLAVAAWPSERDEQLECTFLAVGHGTCVVAETPGGETVLYDAGSLGSPEGAARIIANFLWERGIRRIDAIVLSHADVDHYNAVPTLAEYVPIGVVYVSPMMFDPVATDGHMRAPEYLREQLARHDIPLREIWMGDRLRLRDAATTIEVLFPPREGVIGRDNANSVLLSIEAYGRRILLPGDLEPPGIDLVMSDPPTDCDVLLAPHHGSARSDPPGFAEWCRPEWVVFSGSEASRTISVDKTYRAAGAQVFHTAVAGAVRFAVDGDGVTVYPTIERPRLAGDPLPTVSK